MCLYTRLDVILYIPGEDGTEILFGTADGRVGLVQIGRYYYFLLKYT